MLALLWNISAAIRGYLRFYMPTNRALDWLRTPGGFRWAIPVAAVTVPAYLFATSVAAALAPRPGLGWINLLVLLFLWNATKFAWMATLSPLITLRGRPTVARPEGWEHDLRSDCTGACPCDRAKK